MTDSGAMSGLTVRWSLAEAVAGGADPTELAARLRGYVEDPSHGRFSGMPGLRFKTWRMVAGEWFEGCYVFVDDASRAAFEEQFTAGAAESPGSQIVGAAPVLIERCEVVAIAEGGSGFTSAPTYDR